MHTFKFFRNMLVPGLGHHGNILEARPRALSMHGHVEG
jgi:hypothetical protein